MRGEDAAAAEPGPEISGSPPHARGRRLTHLRKLVDERITPACAGKTWSRRSPRSSDTDHPRMRGEDLGRASGRVVDAGSPPHARGRPVGIHIDCDGSGITPACAGKTGLTSTTRLRGRDHPRMRGEDALGLRFVQLVSGSPPHARGRRGPAGPGYQGPRITPACAGKTSPSPQTTSSN